MKMSCKWILLLFCISLTHNKGTTSWTKDDIRKFIKENLKEFKEKLQKNFDYVDVNHPLKKTQGSERVLSLNVCVKSLDDRLVDRQQKITVISSEVKNAWISSNSNTISILIVKGRVLCREGSKISKGQFDFKINASSILSLNKVTRKMDNKIKLMQSDFEKTLFKTRNQFLKGKLILKSVTLNRTTIDELNNHVIVNRLPTSGLTSALRRNGNQTFRNKISITNVLCIKSTVGFLNENKIEDFVQLNPGTVTVTGSYEFGNVFATTAYVNGAINGQEMDNIVLTSEVQSVYGIKEFKRLSVNNVRASLLGEIRVDDLKEAMIDSTIFPLAVTILPTLIIEGNLNVSSMNGNSLMQLFLNTVKTNKEQNIEGEISFKSMVIDRNLVTGQINNCFFDHFMTTCTKQSIFTDMTFQNISIFQNIITNAVNGVDLSKQAVIKSVKNLLKGRKTFAKNLNVTSITLKKGIAIDTFDPSVETSQIIKKTEIDDYQIFQFNNVKIGNINTTDLEININDLPQLKIFENVWLRTTEQFISRLETKAMHVNKLQVSRVNNISLKDLVTVEGNVTIRKPCIFNQKIFTKTLNLGQKTNVSFSPQYWNNQNVKVKNNITLESAFLKGNLTVGGSLKNFESVLMHITDPQAIKGFVEFENIHLKRLNFTHFNFEQINGTNIRTFLENAVVKPINRSIHNKHFDALVGSYMQNHGLLNNISLSKVALKNSNQTITAPWKFVDALTFQNLTFKNFFGDIQLDDIIYTNQSKAVYNKKFTGKITTNHLYTNGLINGVNVSSLHEEAFNKSKDYSLERNFTFNGKLKTDKLQITGGKINNVSLKDIVRLDELNDSATLNLSNVLAQNVYVSGLINGCDLRSVVENTFKLHQSKNIIARTEAKHLRIEGNLKINNLMTEEFGEWMLYLNKSCSPEIETEIELENINASNISFLQTLNDISVDFLLNDAVRKNLEQDITSEKNFREVIAKKSVIENLYSNKIVGMDARQLYDSCINKTENRMSTLLNPYIKSIVAKQVIVAGKLNNLTLPNDVVLSKVKEVIMSEVVINNTVHVSMGLKIMGKINGMNLGNFIKDRVTLSTDQEIFSALVFNDGTTWKGNTGFNASINNIRLENAIRNPSNQTINGNKHFSVLEVSSDVTVSGFINGMHLEQYLWSSRNESVKEVQFLKLNTRDIICGTINGVNIDDLYNHTHVVYHDVDDKLTNLTFDVQSYKYLLETQEDALEHHSPLLRYFELHEINKFGPVLKFLPVYEYDTFGEKHEHQVTQMVMWINKNQKGCKKISSLTADVSHTGSFNITKQMRGKVFPFSLKMKKDNLVGFYVQAEYTKKCSPHVKNLIIKAIFQNVVEYDNVIDYENVIEYENATEYWNATEYQINSIPMPKGASLLDVQLLDTNDDIFLIVAFSMKDPGERIFLYQYDSLNNSWSQHQKFHMQNLTSLEFIVLERDEHAPDVYLSVTGDKTNAGVMVYGWDFDDNKFDFKTNLSTTASTHAVWMYAHSKLYLFLAKEKVETIRNHSRVTIFNEPLEVYTLDLDDNELELNHIVNIKGICFIEPFIFAGEVFILAISRHMEIAYILQFRGYNGFEVIQEIPAAGVTEARIYTIGNQLYLALNSKTFFIQSRILKASIHGSRL